MYKFAILAHGGASSRDDPEGGAGIRLTPFRKPLALLAKRRKSPELKALAQSLAVS